MYDELVKRLREHNGWALNETLDKAADAIEKLNKRVDYLEDCIYKALDALDRGNDNDWAREALESADEPPKEEA